MKTTISLLLTAAALLLCASAQEATSFSQGRIPIPDLGPDDYGVAGSMNLNPITHTAGIAHFDRAHKKLLYTTYTTGGWMTLTVDSYSRDPSQDYFYCSLAYDPTGVPAIAFFDRDADDLKFARLNAAGDGFVIEPLDTTEYYGTAGRFCSLGYAPDGKAYLSYYHNEFTYDTQGSDEITTLTSDLRVATRSTAGAWSITTVDSGGDVGQGCALTIAATGFPAVSYLDRTTGYLKAAYYNGTTWSKQSFVKASAFTDITTHALNDSTLELTIAFRDPLNNTLVVGAARTSTSGSSNGIIDGGFGYGSIAGSVNAKAPSLAIDSQGNTVMTYYDTLTGDLRISYGFPNEKSSRISSHQSANTVDAWTSLAIGPDGLPFVCSSYTTAAIGGSLQYYNLTGWTLRTINDSDTRVGIYPSLSYGPDRTVGISYVDETHNTLNYVERSASGTWQDKWMDTSVGAGSYSSLSHGPDGLPAIFYTNNTTGIISYAKAGPNGTWSTQPIATDGFYLWGQTTPISTSYGPEGRPAICYITAAPSVLKYSELLADGSWSSHTVDSGGVSPSLKHGPTGQPTIAYYDETLNVLRFAERKADGTWSIQTHDSFGAVGVECSLNYGPNGQPAVSFYDWTNQALKYTERLADGTWDTRTLDSDSVAGWNSSLSFSPQGQPAISYYNFTSSSLKYIERKSDGNWAIQTIDNLMDRTVDVGRFSSLKFSPEGRPTIGYYDLRNRKLKFAECVISPKSIGEAAPFHVISLHRDPTTKAATLSWKGSSGAKYNVEFSPTLAPGSWMEVGNNINALDGMTYFRSTGIGQLNTSAFFRVKRQ